MKSGWFGDDTWFGSVVSCVEITKKLGVHSTFIIKNNKNFFLMKALQKSLSLVCILPSRSLGSNGYCYM